MPRFKYVTENGQLFAIDGKTKYLVIENYGQKYYISSSGKKYTFKKGVRYVIENGQEHKIVRVSEYAEENKEKFEKYGSIEHLSIIKKYDKNPLTKDKEPSKIRKNNRNKMSTYSSKNEPQIRYICENQFGEIIDKSEFMIKYGYEQKELGYYEPIDNKTLMAMKIDEPIAFCAMNGENFALDAGDYVVIAPPRKDYKLIYGMKQEEFERNFKPKKEADKFNRAYAKKYAKKSNEETLL